jgi:hypothetical protein
MDVARTPNRLMFVELSSERIGGDSLNVVAVDEYLVQLHWGTKDDLVRDLRDEQNTSKH